MPLIPAAWPTSPEDVEAMEKIKRDSQKHFDDFVEDIFDELRNHGPIEDLQICENTGAHLVGNVYVKYEFEEDAEKAMKALTGRFYGGRLLVPEYSPVTDFREGRCRQYDLNECQRGGQCNFLHLKRLSNDLERRLFGRRRRRSRYEQRHGREGDDDNHRHHKRSRSSRSRSRDGDRDRDPDRGPDRGPDRDRDRHHDRRSRHSRSRSPRRRRRERERSREPASEARDRDARSASPPTRLEE